MVSDLDNPMNNWIYGRTDLREYYMKVNDQIEKGAKLCPEKTPYLSENKCINCQYVYDVSLGRCAACPPGSKFNHSIHQCDRSSG